MTPEQPPRRPLVTAGTTSWQQHGATADHDLLAEFLAGVAATDTIQAAIARAAIAMRMRSGDSVLDAGCGTGAALSALATAVGPTGIVIGLDHGLGFLRDARAGAEAGGYGERVRLVRGDLHHLPFPDGSFAAAHTERVLMHVDDPDRALRELARVVRPGGWVVCVEPDLAGMRVDATDANAAAKVVAGFCTSIAHPAMGLELNRRMAGVGLIERTVETLTAVERAYDEDTAAFILRAAETASTRGGLARRRAEALLAEWQQAGETGTYTSYSSMFIVAGRVPKGE